jgi:hypothetical protein
MIPGFEIRSIITHAQNVMVKGEYELWQWADVTVRIPKDFDFEKGGAQLLKKLQQAAELIGRAG